MSIPNEPASEVETAGHVIVLTGPADGEGNAGGDGNDDGHGSRQGDGEETGVGVVAVDGDDVATGAGLPQAATAIPASTRNACRVNQRLGLPQRIAITVCAWNHRLLPG